MGENYTVVPFGKYKDKPIEVMLGDQQYLDWLSAQPWFKERYLNIYNIVIGAGHEPADTPEHNRLQIMFLDKEFVAKFLVRIKVKSVRPDQIGFEVKKASGFDGRNRKFIWGPPIDVCIGDYQNLSATYRGGYLNEVVWIEIKPTVGDDFPAVLRQMESSGARILFIENYSGSGATFEQFCAFFATAQIQVVTLKEVLEVSGK